MRAGGLWGVTLLGDGAGDWAITAAQQEINITTVAVRIMLVLKDISLKPVLTNHLWEQMDFRLRPRVVNRKILPETRSFARCRGRRRVKP